MTSTIKVNTIQNACGADIIKESSNTITIGASGDTVALASGASQSGFGRTGTVDWQTTVKTSGFTASNGEGYFVDTSSGAVSVNLPAGTAGAIVAFKDYLNSFDTHSLTLVQNGSDKIGGSTNNAVISEEGIAITLVFIDSTRGWLITNSGLQSEASLPSFIAATGGTVSTVCTNFKVHTFTGPGTFCVSNAGNAAGSNSVEYIVVAGGGAGGVNRRGGGGAGGFRFASPTLAPATYPAKPLAGPANIPVTATSFPITVGGGATGSCSPTPNDGSVSTFSTITSTGGGGAYTKTPSSAGNGGPGGSGGGGYEPSGSGGSGNTPPVSPAQGTDGGTGGSGGSNSGGGGGGALVAGTNQDSSNPAAPGGNGAGVPSAFGTSGQNCGSFYYFSGGGGGGTSCAGSASTGGLGGGGAGNASGGTGTAGTTNTGGGGGGAGQGGGGSNGGSGIVIIRYKFQ